MSMSASFLSSSGDAIHTVECIGEPVTSLRCTCSGYRNLRACKHIDALLQGSSIPSNTVPADGYTEICEKLQNSPARKAFEDLQGHLANLEAHKARLNEDARSAKKEFYRKLAEGFSDN
jgi:hypothetical protein